jgi:hypothetical protein
MKQKKRTVYEAPLTERFRVEMEAAFCAASGDVIKKDNSGLNAEGHDQGQLNAQVFVVLHR